jgi:hypothetical protein
MNTQTDLITAEREEISRYADWYSQQGYQVALEPAARELPEFLRMLAPDLIARRDGDNVVVEIKTSSPESFEKVQRLARALEHRAGWRLQVVYLDLADPEWQPPLRLPDTAELASRLANIDAAAADNPPEQPQILMLWSIVEAAARHRLTSVGISPTSRISSSALIKMLVTEGVIEDEQYSVLRRGLALRNVVAHGFLNQPIDPALFRAVRDAAHDLLVPANR